MDKYVTILIAALGSSGVCEIIKYILNQRTNKNIFFSEIDEIKQSITSLTKKIEQNQAEQSRIRILRFNEELSEKNFSKEFFRQTLFDIKVYENYCKKDLTFENGYTNEAAKHIRNVYQQKLETNDFGK